MCIVRRSLLLMDCEYQDVDDTLSKGPRNPGLSRRCAVLQVLSDLLKSLATVSTFRKFYLENGVMI
jgi:hypothetical protein